MNNPAPQQTTSIPRLMITPQDREAIWFVLRRNFGPDVQVWVFGSRVDGKDTGDFDLYIEYDDALERPLLALGRSIEQLQALLERKVDLLARGRDEPKTAFEQIAKRRGVALPP